MSAELENITWLGERHSNAFVTCWPKVLSQIEVVSYGEEKPADGGHDESAWRFVGWK